MSVVDASVWLDVVAGHLGPEALPPPPIAVPGHFDAEVLSGLRGLCRGGQLDESATAGQVEVLRRAPLLRVAVPELLAEAWSLSAAVSSYDALYVALARRESMVLHTADARLARGAGDLCEVRLVGGRPPTPPRPPGARARR